MAACVPEADAEGFTHGPSFDRVKQLPLQVGSVFGGRSRWQTDACREQPVSRVWDITPPNAPFCGLKSLRLEQIGCARLAFRLIATRRLNPYPLARRLGSSDMRSFSCGE